MTSSTSNVKLGVCTVLFNGVDLGYTQGGVEVAVATSTHEILVDQFGTTPIGELITGRTVSVKCPLAETTLDNLVAIMPGSSLHTDGVKASATATFATTPPVNNDKVTLAGVDFTFKTSPVGPNDMAIPASLNAAATALAAAIQAAGIGFDATAAGAVTTITNQVRGVAGNSVTLAKTGTNTTVTTFTGGVDVTKAKVVVSSGININLLAAAKTLTLRPKGTTGADDFTVFQAACPGALTFSYKQDKERIYEADFKGYVQSDGTLFAVGDVTAA